MFKLICKRKLNDGAEKWEIVVKTVEHNRSFPDNLSGHPSARQLDVQQEKTFQDMVSVGAKPSVILKTITKNSNNCLFKKKDVYNKIQSIRLQLLDGKTAVEALLESLRSGPFHYSVHFDENGHVNRLFFTHHKSINLATQYSSVFQLDCTYKTNRFKMPLLNIIGITATFSSFNAGFAFISQEREADYVWILKIFSQLVPSPGVFVTDRELALMKGIRKIYPNTVNLLCLWHINKNIYAKCRPFFPSRHEDYRVFVE